MVHFSHPGTPIGSLGDTLYQLIEASGLTIVISGHYEPNYMVRELQEKVPFFAESRPLPNGLAERPGMESLWGMLDGEQASAVFLFVHPADVSEMVKVIDDLRRLQQFTMTIMNNGDMDAIAAHPLAGAEAYPVQNVIGVT